MKTFDSCEKLATHMNAMVPPPFWKVLPDGSCVMELDKGTELVMVGGISAAQEIMMWVRRKKPAPLSESELNAIVQDIQQLETFPHLYGNTIPWSTPGDTPSTGLT